MQISEDNNRTRKLVVDGCITFEMVTNFKYLKVNNDERANIYEEIKQWLVAANWCYFGFIYKIKSKILSWKTKITRFTKFY